jgi:Rad3-related DNA helicase
MVASRAPSNWVLEATSSDSNHHRLRDGVSQALHAIVQAVPDGMLVFVSSNGMLSKLYACWKQSGWPSILSCVSRHFPPLLPADESRCQGLLVMVVKRAVG